MFATETLWVFSPVEALKPFNSHSSYTFHTYVCVEKETDTDFSFQLLFHNFLTPGKGEQCFILALLLVGEMTITFRSGGTKMRALARFESRDVLQCHDNTGGFGHEWKKQKNGLDHKYDFFTSFEKNSCMAAFLLVRKNIFTKRRAAKLLIKAHPNNKTKALKCTLLCNTVP